MAHVADGEDPSRPELTTFGALFDAWLEQHAKKKIDTWKDEKRRYEMYLSGPPAVGAPAEDPVPYRIKKGLALGPRVFAEIDRKDVGAVRDEVLEKAGPIQSNRIVALFNRVANWAVEEGHAKFNPAARLRKLGEERRRERVLTSDELTRLSGGIRTRNRRRPFGRGANRIRFARSHRDPARPQGFVPYGSAP